LGLFAGSQSVNTEGVYRFATMSGVVGNFFFRTKMDQMLLYCRENQLLASLYVFVCPFVSVAPISWNSMKAYIGDFRENQFGKTQFC